MLQASLQTLQVTKDCSVIVYQNKLAGTGGVLSGRV